MIIDSYKFASAFTPIKIDCGGTGAGDFITDTYFSGGNTFDYNNAGSIDNTHADGVTTAVLETIRYNSTTYTIPVEAGRTYTVKTYHCADNETTRLQDISINGVLVADNFDSAALAVSLYGSASNKAVKQTFTGVTPNGSNEIVIFFDQVVNAGLVCGIVIAA